MFDVDASLKYIVSHTMMPSLYLPQPMGHLGWILGIRTYCCSEI